MVRILLPVLLGITHPLRRLDGPAKPTSTLVKVVAVLISYLATRFATAILATLLEPGVQVGADDALVELGAADVLHAIEGILVRVILDKTESARGLLKSVQTHD